VAYALSDKMVIIDLVWPWRSILQQKLWAVASLP